MRKLLAVFLIVLVVCETGFAQQETRHRSGPRRQLATIVFAGLGGAILGLSTLSFYGRPQDQLSNIAIGFAVGVIAGTAYVTVRSATTRDYYDDNKNIQGLNLLPLAPEPQTVAVEEPKMVWSPTLLRSSPTESPTLGGQFQVSF